MKKRFLSCAIVLLLVIACISGLSARAYAAENGPKITLNYSTKDVDVNHGFSLVATLEAQGSGTISWSSSDTYVASVSASGYVIGKNAGKATITATYRGSDGSTTSKSCNVHVTVEDGMYYIKNAYSDLCMYGSGGLVSLQNQETDEAYRAERLWYVEYVPSHGRYIIRPMSDFSVGMGIDDNKYVRVGQLGYYPCWDIVKNSFGYSIHYYEYTNGYTKPIVADQPGSHIYLGNWETNLKCHWELEKANGIFLRDTRTKQIASNSSDIMLGIGRTCDFSDLPIKIEIYGNMSGGITLSSNNTQVINVYTTELTAVNSGTAKITVSARLNGITYSHYCYVQAKSAVMVLSNKDAEWLPSSQTMGNNLADSIGTDCTDVQEVTSQNFADIWNNAIVDHIIIHTHGSPECIQGEDLWFFTYDIVQQLERNTSIGFVLITACETGGQNGADQNFASLLSQYIAEDGVVVCSTTNVEGIATEFVAQDGGEWIAYCNGEQIPCDLPTTITMALVAEYWEEFK